MKKILFLLSLLVFVGTIEAQIVTIADVNFESTPSGWIITPTNYWTANTDLYAGGQTSYHGFVPIGNQGDTVILTSPLYDFGLYRYAFLSFNQICKVSGSDICQIEYRENIMGASWKVIPRSSYKGSGIYTNAVFCDGSYTDWLPGDSLAIPTNNWWKTELFDISNEVSFAEVQFRFKITKGNVIGSQIAYGWLIDNFKLTASINPIAPPVVELISNYGDTVYNTGPFVIKAKVATRTYAPILNPKLYYTTTFNNITSHDSVMMTAVEGDSIWTATIPQHLFGTSITFSIVGYDSVGNNNSVNSAFYLKRGVGGHTIGYTYYYPADTTGATNNNLAIIFHANKINSWSRSLYLASEVGSSTQDLTITSLAWYNRTYNYVYLRPNVNVYMKCTAATSNTNLTHEIPSISGATLVYSGPVTTSLSWNEIKLLPAFNVPIGSNLMIYFEDSSGIVPGTSIIYWAGHLDNTRTVYQYDGSSVTQSSMAPLMRFGLGVIVNDTNSVAMHSIDNPKNSVFVNPSAQIPVVVTIKNKGIANLDSCYIDWTLNGIPQVRHTWRGNLPDDFNATDTIGYFSPAANQYDTIMVWVSMPNGVYDSTTYDDTLVRVTYGMSGLDMYFVTSYGDTVYNTGPFPIQAYIASLTHTSVALPINLQVKYTFNNIDSYDTLRMDSIGNNIYEAIISQHIFGTDIEYSITLLDSLGNVCSIINRFHIKRGIGGELFKIL
jgi:hypothetical protein